MNIKLASLKGAEATGLRILSVGGLILASLGVCAAEEAQQKVEEAAATPSKELKSLDPTTILANRMETDLSKVGKSVSVLDAGLLQEQGIENLREALKFVPGVISASTSGQRGSYGSIFIRGTKSEHVHMIVDGMRISDASFNLGSYLGQGNLNGLSKIEVLRGPQSALYGGESIGGVLGIYTEKGEGEFSGDLRVEGGSFNSWNSSLGVQGAEGDFSYALSLGDERTDNDVPNNKFEMQSYSLRLDYVVNPCLDLGFTLRGMNSSLMQPDYYNPATYLYHDDVSFDSTLATIFADYQVNDSWQSKLTLGVYDQKYSTKYTSNASPWLEDYDNNFTKYAAYWDNTVTWNDQHTTVIGGVVEYTDASTVIDAEGNKGKTRNQFGVYANHLWDVTENWNVTGGLRWEDYDDFGDEVTWQVSTNYTIDSTQTVLSGNIGKGFRAPTFTEIYGGAWNAPSPDLGAETSLGWDLGIEQPFCDDQYKVGVTYFASRIDNSIQYDFSGYYNLSGVTEVSGVEGFIEGRFIEDRLNVMLTYTWMDRAMVDLPDNVLGLRAGVDVTDAFDTGVTLSYMDSRSYGGNNLDSYVVVNLYGNYEMNENVKLTARVENLFNEDYEYGSFGDPRSIAPGRGIGFFGGVTLSW